MRIFLCFYWIKKQWNFGLIYLMEAITILPENFYFFSKLVFYITIREDIVCCRRYFKAKFQVYWVRTEEKYLSWQTGECVSRLQEPDFFELRRIKFRPPECIGSRKRRGRSSDISDDCMHKSYTNSHTCYTYFNIKTLIYCWCI